MAAPTRLQRQYDRQLVRNFSATVTVYLSNNNGATWTSAGTQAATGTATYATNGYTDVCAAATTYSSGTVSVTITTGTTGPGGQGSGPSSAVSSVTGSPTNLYTNGVTPHTIIQVPVISTATITSITNVGGGGGTDTMNCTGAANCGLVVGQIFYLGYRSAAGGSGLGILPAACSAQGYTVASVGTNFVTFLDNSTSCTATSGNGPYANQIGSWTYSFALQNQASPKISTQFTVDTDGYTDEYVYDTDASRIDASMQLDSQGTIGLYGYVGGGVVTSTSGDTCLGGTLTGASACLSGPSTGAKLDPSGNLKEVVGQVTDTSETNGSGWATPLDIHYLTQASSYPTTLFTTNASTSVGGIGMYLLATHVTCSTAVLNSTVAVVISFYDFSENVGGYSTQTGPTHSCTTGLQWTNYTDIFMLPQDVSRNITVNVTTANSPTFYLRTTLLNAH